MAKPWILNAHAAKTIVVRRAAGHAVATIANDMKISMASVYNVLEGKTYSEVTRSLRWRARKLLNQVKKQRLRDEHSHVDYRVIGNPQKILAEAARLCVHNAKRIHEEATDFANREIDRGDRLRTLRKYL